MQGYIYIYIYIYYILIFSGVLEIIQYFNKTQVKHMGRELDADLISGACPEFISELPGFISEHPGCKTCP